MGVTTPPKWCAMEWYAAAAAAAAAHSSPESTWLSRTRRCYVDPSACSMPFAKSVFFPGLSVYYSYEACGSSNTFSLITASEVDVVDVTSRVEEYTCATKLVLEQQLQSWREGKGDKTVQCSYLDSCPCTDCAYAAGWNQAVNLQDSVLVRPASCEDSAQFQDEQGYSCRGWAKFPCADAVETWGYSQSGENAVIANCPIGMPACGSNRGRADTPDLPLTRSRPAPEQRASSATGAPPSRRRPSASRRRSATRTRAPPSPSTARRARAGSATSTMGCRATARWCSGRRWTGARRSSTRASNRGTRRRRPGPRTSCSWSTRRGRCASTRRSRSRPRSSRPRRASSSACRRRAAPSPARS